MIAKKIPAIVIKNPKTEMALVAHRNGFDVTKDDTNTDIDWLISQRRSKLLTTTSGASIKQQPRMVTHQ